MITVEKTAGGITHVSPFVGPTNHTITVKVDISDLTTKEVDEYGYIKPGVPLDKNGNTIGDGIAVHGCIIEAQKIVDAKPTDESLAANTGTKTVVIATHCVVNRDILEDVLGRALTAYEIAGFDLAGSKCVLTRT